MEAIAKDKAERAFAVVKSPVLVEDVALVFTALKQLPGPLIKWFLEALENDGLCRMLDAYQDRGAQASVVFALCDQTDVHTFSASIEGTIAQTPRGKMGFGWDPIFIPSGHTKTWGEMTNDEKHETSMRKIALEQASRYLATVSDQISS